VFLCAKGIPCFGAIWGLFWHSLVRLGGIPCFGDNTVLERRLERFVPVESEGSRQEKGVSDSLFTPKGKRAEKPIERVMMAQYEYYVDD